MKACERKTREPLVLRFILDNLLHSFLLPKMGKYFLKDLFFKKFETLISSHAHNSREGGAYILSPSKSIINLRIPTWVGFKKSFHLPILYLE